MNYLHSYHAGNFADVIKHIILTLVIQYSQRKEKGFRILDTHAGSGSYQLESEAAKTTGEAEAGIQRLFEDGDLSQMANLPPNLIEMIQPYIDVLKALNPNGQLTTYPGSPQLARHLMRKQDRLTACELRRSEAIKLKNLFADDFQVKTIEIDGWLAMKSFLPFKEKRGVILIDPPYEKPREFEQALESITQGIKRSPSTTYLLWYPVKAFYQCKKWADMVARPKPELGVENILRTELYIRPADNDYQLNGGGMFIFNPPFTLEEQLQRLLPALQRLVADPTPSKHYSKTLIEMI
ncbi:MAG: 23S rRNA (adenine(2030)-N(6))-methyltransferase RlmJ [Rhizobiales bacterium]|nr:23S rRNA (adenine(2030)-N(6))-methyltransferase RlmJ [Hyphomicrobiales bacterium]